MEDSELLEAWRGSDEAAGKALVNRHFAPLYRYFLNKAPANAEDLVQETFLALVESRDRLREATAFRAYLFGVARRRLFRYWRDRKGDDVEARPVEELSAHQTEIPDALARHQEQKLLLKALRQLPLRDQSLLELSYFEGLTDRELAAIEEIPPGTLKSRLRKARADLERAMAAVAGPELLESTTRDFEQWVLSVKAQLSEPVPASCS